MEGIQRQEGVEQERGEWRSLKAEAPAQADDLIAHVEGFDDMNADEQLRAYQSLLLTLASDNANRFIAEEVAQRATLLERENAYQKTAELTHESPSGRILTQA